VNESLSLAIRHHTGFTYDGIAKSSYNEARMTPISARAKRSATPHRGAASGAALDAHRLLRHGRHRLRHPRAAPEIEVEARSNVESRAGLIAPAISWSDLRAPRSSTSSRSTCSQLTGPS